MGTVYSTNWRGDTCIKLSWPKNLKGRDHLQDLVKERRMVLEWFLDKQVRKVWTGFIWLRVGTSGGLL